MADKKITIVIGGEASGGVRAFGQTETAGNKLQATIGKVATAVGGVFAATEAFGFLKDSIKEAASEDQAIAVLTTTMKNTVGATDAQVASTEKWITKMQNATGILDDQLRPALGKLLIAGRTTTQAEADLGVAADIAAARHLDLETVVQAMSKAAQGTTGSLQKLGIATKDASGNALTYDQILKAASQTMGGAAATAADTAAGKAAILSAEFKDLKEKIGNGLLPVLQQLTEAITVLVGWISNIDGRVVAVIATVAGLVAVFAATVSVLGVLTDAAALFGVTLTLALGPIALVVAAIAAVAAGVIYAYFHFDAFRRVVDTVVAAVVDEVKILAEGFKILASDVVTVWNVIIDAVDGAWKFIDPILKKITSGIQTVTGALSHLPGGFLSGAASAIAGPIGAFIPHGATGFQNFPGGLALVGEDGPEIVHMPRGANLYPNGTGPGSSTSVQETIVLQIGTEQIIGLVREYERTNGKSWRDA